MRIARMEENKLVISALPLPASFERISQRVVTTIPQELP
jgi:hypothetical protein